MKAVCAWCQKTLVSEIEETTKGSPITHGICMDCAQFVFLKQEGVKLRDFLDDIPAPVLVIDGDGHVLHGNQTALKFLGKDLATIKGLPGGNVFECVYSRLPEGCGKTVHCSGCTIRQAVMGTMASGKARDHANVSLYKSWKDEIERIDLTVSTERVADVVVLKIDG